MYLYDCGSYQLALAFACSTSSRFQLLRAQYSKNSAVLGQKMVFQRRGLCGEELQVRLEQLDDVKKLWQGLGA